jgi:biopolymer transport protein TolR
MGMSGGGTGGAVSEINVTPLIDVLLVLLIIFMVIVPVTPHGLDAIVPQPPKDKTQSEPNPDTIVVQVLENGTATPSYKINDTAFNKQDIEPKLLQIFSIRNNKTMFVKGDKDLDYSKVAEVINFGHEAGVENIGLITPRVESGQ